MLDIERVNRGRYMARTQEVRKRDGGPDCEVSLLYESVSEWSVCAHILNIENQIDFESCCMNRVVPRDSIWFGKWPILCAACL